jgi:hypothetical protein
MSADPAIGDDLYAAATAAQRQGRFAEAVRLLRQASEAGHVASMTLLGGQLLSGRGAPPDPSAGARLVRRAAELGGAYACTLLATVLGAGVGGPADWSGALDWLQRSAELGYASAGEQLRLLADPSRPGAAANWAGLRRRVDLGAWRRPPRPRALCADPEIAAVEGFATPAVCSWIIARATDRLAPAQVFDVGAHGPVRDSLRTNSVAGLDILGADLVILLLRERIAALAGAPVSALEAPQALHYAVGQEFRPHHDFLEADVAGHAPSLEARGQRVRTVLVYLNAGFEGGETAFPLLGLKFRGGTGEALTFRNVDARGEPDPRTLHAGLPPIAGEKWLLSQWVRGL